MDTSLTSQIILSTATLLAALGGFVLAGLNEANRDRRARKREQEARAFERAERLSDRRHDFQLETLLALQDAVQALTRLTGRTFHFDHMNARDQNYTQLPDGWSEEIQANGVEVNRLKTRVLDVGVRDAVLAFSTHCIEMTMTPSGFKGLSGEELENFALSKMNQMSVQVALVMDALGEAIRSELGRN